MKSSKVSPFNNFKVQKSEFNAVKQWKMLSNKVLFNQKMLNHNLRCRIENSPQKLFSSNWSDAKVDDEIINSEDDQQAKPVDSDLDIRPLTNHFYLQIQYARKLSKVRKRINSITIHNKIH